MALFSSHIDGQRARYNWEFKSPGWARHKGLTIMSTASANEVILEAKAQ